MRETLPLNLEAARVTEGRMASTREDGPNGMFVLFKERAPKTHITIVSSAGDGWEHVSISTPTRCPTWAEMCLVKGLFWQPDECVMQLHPPESEWVNNHPYCLHLWRPTEADIPRPPSIMVGVKTADRKPLKLNGIQAAALVMAANMGLLR